MKKLFSIFLILLTLNPTFVIATKTVYFSSNYQEEDGEPVKFYSVPSGRVMGKGGELYYIIADHLGSTTIVTDSSGNKVGEMSYYPYGSTFSSEGDVPTEKKYTGQILDDSTGYYFYNARYYNPEVANFLSPDMAGDGYRYANNNPVMYSDPSGNMVEMGGGYGGGGPSVYLPTILRSQEQSSPEPTCLGMGGEWLEAALISQEGGIPEEEVGNEEYLNQIYEKYEVSPARQMAELYGLALSSPAPGTNLGLGAKTLLKRFHGKLGLNQLDEAAQLINAGKKEEGIQLIEKVAKEAGFDPKIARNYGEYRKMLEEFGRAQGLREREIIDLISKAGGFQQGSEIYAYTGSNARTALHEVTHALIQNAGIGESTKIGGVMSESIVYSYEYTVGTLTREQAWKGFISSARHIAYQ